MTGDWAQSSRLVPALDHRDSRGKKYSNILSWSFVDLVSKYLPRIHA